METTHTRNGGKNEIPANTETHRKEEEAQIQRGNNRKTSRKTGSSSQKEELNRTRRALKNIDPWKQTTRRQPHLEDEVLPNDEEPIQTQPAIEIIITPPSEQGNANPNDKPGQQKQQKENRGHAQNTGTERTNDAGGNRRLEQSHETRRQKGTGADNAKRPPETRKRGY